MSLSKGEALARDVANWRLQEYTEISFFAFYVYYVLTTMDKEVSVILPQRWNRGKLMYMIIRYGLVLYIAMRFARDYRTYFVISPQDCKAMFIIYTIARRSVFLTCDVALGLCLSALLQVGVILSIAILGLSLAIPVASAILNLVGGIQYPPEPVTGLDVELGYPCYLVSFSSFSTKTIMYDRRDIRAYTELVATIVLALLGIFALFVRYKGHNSRLIQVLRRDGGIDYLSLIGIRLVLAIIYTPSVATGASLEGSTINLVANRANEVIITILAQRLLINMRKVDYVGTQPFVSKLLFAKTVPGSSSEEDGYGEEAGFASVEGTLHESHTGIEMAGAGDRGDGGGDAAGQDKDKDMSGGEVEKEKHKVEGGQNV